MSNRPKRKAAEKAAVLEPDSPSPAKRRKTTRKRTEKAPKSHPQEEQPEAPTKDTSKKRTKTVKKPALPNVTETNSEETNSEQQPSTLKEDLPKLPKRRRRASLGKEEQPAEVQKKTSKKRTESAAKVDSKPAPLNATTTNWEQIDFGCDKKNVRQKGYNLKVTSWNVDGLRAWLKKDGLKILTYDKPDILCLQETKCSTNKLPDEIRQISGYHDYWVSSDKEGYAGVGVLTKIMPTEVIYGIGKEDHDSEGRCLTLEFEGFYLVNVYVPNAGRGLVTLTKRLDWNKHFKAFVKNLDATKPVIVCGDMNVAHHEIDLTNPKTNKKNAGFTQEEREGMTDFLQDGYIDTFRFLYPDQANVYTFWSYMNKARSKNIGWRLDYFILSNRLKEKVCDCVMRSQVYGSDHCPISLFISI